ncbi:hypothetical protein RUND412_003471 [Rhizina undulata]
MPISALISSLRLRSRAQEEREGDREAYQANTDKLLRRFKDVFVRSWDLGFTAFGGPPVHFQILHRRFVDGRGKVPWIDEQTYQELFAVCQALPGPGSTKMAFCITLIHAGFLPAIFVFTMWSLPGALGMYALSLGVQRMNEVLPSPVYALLSGLNASTVGIIALAAVQLATKSITDPLTRVLVVIGACAGLCYNALWYFPLLMVIGGTATVTWDLWAFRTARRVRSKLSRKKLVEDPEREPIQQVVVSLDLRVPEPAARSRPTSVRSGINVIPPEPVNATEAREAQEEVKVKVPTMDTSSHAIPVKIGFAIIASFFAFFIALMIARGVVRYKPLLFDLFANMFLAGTIIFGGGPVVIPLLREYVVQPGWVSPRDFLLGLAIIQAFPGPNFNFAVYLGALALVGSSTPTFLGAFLSFIGIFLPGITLAVGVQSLWRVLRTKPFTTSLLRGVNATAVGLVFTAVYRLWEIGYLTPENSGGVSLASEPWWVVIAAVTYTACAWFRVPPAAGIVAGAALGLVWFGVVKA